MLEDQIKDLQAMVSLEQVDEELTDEELDGVAGGGAPIRSTTTMSPVLTGTRIRR